MGRSDQTRLLNADWRVQAFALVSPLASTATVAVFFLACLALGLNLRVSLWSTIALAVASPVFGFAGTCWTQPLAMLFVTAANLQLIYCLAEPRAGRTVACGALLAAAILVRPDMLVLAPIMMGVLVWQAWRRLGVRRAALTATLACLPLVLAGFFLLLWNWLRFSQLWVLPGGNQLMLFKARWMPEGFVGQLFSPGAGLLWYFPFLILAVFGLRRLEGLQRTTCRLVVMQTAAVVLLYSAWWQWFAPLAPGPRYSLPVTPVLALAAAFGLARARRRLWTVAKGLVGLGLVVQIPLVLLSAQKIPDVTDPSVWLSFRCFTGWWSMWYSAVVREPLFESPPGIDCLSTESWFFLITGLAALGAGAVLARRFFHLRAQRP